jgi:hypothetical protein
MTLLWVENMFEDDQALHEIAQRRAKEAAHYLTQIWRAHDEKNEKTCMGGAFGLYGILTDASSMLKSRAAEKLMQAYWMSDEAEKFQLSDPEKEDECYNDACRLIETSRALVGLEMKSAQFTVKWWKAYRHKNKDAVLENLVKEHMCQITGNNNVEIAGSCSYLVYEAADEHKNRNWKAVEKRLTEYFNVYFLNLSKRVMMRAPTN